MTAIVGVMNKHAVAIAADSAVTMGNTHKVVNTGNKLFMLSKYEPVGIATYSNAALMGTPWEIIIKMYRKRLGEKVFPHLQNYVDDFIKYLHSNNFFCDNQTQKEWLIIQINAFVMLNKHIVCKQQKIDNLDFSSSEHFECFKDELTRCLKANKLNTNSCEDFKDYEYKEFKTDTQDVFDSFLATDPNFPVALRDLLAEAFFHYWKIKLEPEYSTGLVFCGYGEDEIYPSIISVIVSSGINGKLKYFQNDIKTFSIQEHGTNVAIAPFAQTDVIQTITQGLTPDCRNIIFETIKNGVNSYTSVLSKYLFSRPNGKVFADEIDMVDTQPIIETLHKGVIDSMKNTYTKPLLNTIAGLAKEDLANMAESFISLTCLIRRMSPHEETVGWPIDVAVISKGDGFVWMNRKHYFSPDLNSHFFRNYYR